MQNPTSSLFQLALGITPPWEVDRLEFDADQRRLDIHVDFKRGSKFVCPERGAGDCPVHDVVDKEWRPSQLRPARGLPARARASGSMR